MAAGAGAGAGAAAGAVATTGDWDAGAAVVAVGVAGVAGAGSGCLAFSVAVAGGDAAADVASTEPKLIEPVGRWPAPGMPRLTVTAGFTAPCPALGPRVLGRRE